MAISLVRVITLEKSIKSLYLLVLILLVRPFLNKKAFRSASIILWIVLLIYLISPYELMIGIDCVKKNGILSPTELIKKFDEQKEPLYQTIRALMMQNDKLIKQRDMLLPRLMSGKLEV